MTPILIGVAGPSGSGKTTLAKALARELAAPLISLDFYYHDLADAPMHERAATNFDHPDALEHQLLFHHLNALRRGMSVKLPVYDFSTHTRVPNMHRTLAPSEYVVVEGLFLLHWHQLRDVLDLRVYVRTADELCFQRRRERDIRERGRTPVCIASQYEKTVRPMAEKFIHPTAGYADLIVDGTASVSESVDGVLARIPRERSKSVSSVTASLDSDCI